ncbi:amidohydrolase family protein [Streptomyces sp. NPDC051569]|uniref:amidohydrolase family protein n=1 Tax=Streptomyces sp. NPDC051569 TaxID=3365661 RepID=UPI00378D91F3
MTTAAQNNRTIPSTVFHGFRLIVGDGREPIDEAALVVRDGLVVAAGPYGEVDIPDGASLVSLAGRTVMPTIVNPHGHIGYYRGTGTDKAHFDRANVIDHLRRFVYHGVSVFQSLGTDRDDIELAVRDDQRAGVLDDPELALLLSASNGLAAPTPGAENGGAFFAPDVIREVSTPDEARATVREIAAKNPDVIKFWVDDRNGTKQKLAPEVYEAIVDEAHRHGKKAIAHIYELADAKGVVRAGADGTAHMVREPGPDDELLTLLRDSGAFVFTSMSIQRGLQHNLGWLDDPLLAETVGDEARERIRTQFSGIPAETKEALNRGYQVLEASLLTYVNAGVTVLMSADTGVLTQFPGFAEHREIEAMVDAGMPALEAIKASTLLPARMLGLTDRGSLEPGKRADFIVLTADPLDAITNTRTIESVHIAGAAVDRERMRTSFLV